MMETLLAASVGLLRAAGVAPPAFRGPVVLPRSTHEAFMRGEIVGAAAASAVWGADGQLLRPDVVSAHPYLRAEDPPSLGVLLPERMATNTTLAPFVRGVMKAFERTRHIKIDSTGSVMRNALAADRLSAPRVYMLRQAEMEHGALALLDPSTNTLLRLRWKEQPQLRLDADTGAWRVGDKTYAMVSVLPPGAAEVKKELLPSVCGAMRAPCV